MRLFRFVLIAILTYVGGSPAGGMYAVALAYRGTANNSAIRRLLHFAVSDVSDDVRRAAVLSLGLVLYQASRSSLPASIVSLQTHPLLVSHPGENHPRPSRTMQIPR